MGRPSLELGTAGKIRYVRSGSAWIARAGYRDYDGRVRDVERSGPTKAAASRSLKAALRDRSHQSHEASINGQSKLAAVAEAWWTGFLERAGSLSSRDIYRESLDNYILPGLGEVKCYEFSVGVAERFLTKLLAERGPSVTKTARTVLSNIGAFAARMDAIDRNPVRDTSPVEIKKKKVVALSAAEAMQVRAYITYHPRSVRRGVPELVDFMSATGKRIGECLAVTADAVNVAQRTVEVRGTVIYISGMGTVFKRMPKTESGYRTLTLPDWVMPAVQAGIANAKEVTVQVFKAADGTEYLIPPRLAKAGRRASVEKPWLQDVIKNRQESAEVVAFIFPSELGTIWDPSNASKDVKAAFQFAGLEERTSHVLRKTVATMMDDAGVPVRKIADQLGQKRTSVTQDFYLDRKDVVTAGASVLESLKY